MSKILIVDDEADVREFSRHFFHKQGIEVLLADDGAQALQILERDVPDLVLLDVRMDGFSGIDVLRELRRRSIAVKVLMVSGVEDADMVTEALNLGSLGFIHKPLDLDALKRVVAFHLTK